MVINLREKVLEVTIFLDSAIEMFIEQTDLAITGPNNFLAEGSLFKEVGTKLLGLAAKDSEIPFYAVCGAYKTAELLWKEVDWRSTILQRFLRKRDHSKSVF